MWWITQLRNVLRFQANGTIYCTVVFVRDLRIISYPISILYHPVNSHKPQELSCTKCRKSSKQTELWLLKWSVNWTQTYLNPEIFLEKYKQMFKAVSAGNNFCLILKHRASCNLWILHNSSNNIWTENSSEYDLKQEVQDSESSRTLTGKSGSYAIAKRTPWLGPCLINS